MAYNNDTPSISIQSAQQSRAGRDDVWWLPLRSLRIPVVPIWSLIPWLDQFPLIIDLHPLKQTRALLSIVFFLAAEEAAHQA